jgi:hypothetical protein
VQNTTIENGSGVCTPAALNVATPTNAARRGDAVTDASANPPGGGVVVVVVVVGVLDVVDVVLVVGGGAVVVVVVVVVPVVVVVGGLVDPPRTVAWTMQCGENESPHVTT